MPSTWRVPWTLRFPQTCSIPSTPYSKPSLDFALQTWSISFTLSVPWTWGTSFPCYHFGAFLGLRLLLGLPVHLDLSTFLGAFLGAFLDLECSFLDMDVQYWIFRVPQFKLKLERFIGVGAFRGLADLLKTQHFKLRDSYFLGVSWLWWIHKASYSG